jgi:hypothetical protein
MPIHRLMRGRTQVRAGGILQPVFSCVSHNSLSSLSTLPHAPRWYTYLELKVVSRFPSTRQIKSSQPLS